MPDRNWWDAWTAYKAAELEYHAAMDDLRNSFEGDQAGYELVVELAKKRTAAHDAFLAAYRQHN